MAKFCVFVSLRAVFVFVYACSGVGLCLCDCVYVTFFYPTIGVVTLSLWMVHTGKCFCCWCLSI